MNFIYLVNEFNTLLDKYTVKCQEIKDSIIKLSRLSISLDLDKDGKIPHDDFNTYQEYLSVSKYYNTEKQRYTYNDEAREVSRLFDIYLDSPKTLKLVKAYINKFKLELAKIEPENKRKPGFECVPLKFLNKAIRTLNAFLSYLKVICKNCGHFMTFNFSSEDINEPIFRRRRAVQLNRYLTKSIQYYRENEHLYLRFLTLTIKRIKTKDMSKEVLREFKNLFRKFSKRKFFKVDGYASVLEIKHYKEGEVRKYKDYNSKELIYEEITAENEGYHIHLHILLLGQKDAFIPINTKVQEKFGREVNEKETIEWNWKEVCNKSKINLFHGSYITNIQTPEDVERIQAKRKNKKELSEDEKTSALISYLTSYVTKVDTAVKQNEYDFETDVKDESVQNCPFLRYIDSTQRINFIQFGGVLLPNGIKKIKELADLVKKKKEKRICQVCTESEWRATSSEVHYDEIFDTTEKDLDFRKECLKKAFRKLESKALAT
ncbi:MAG: hypothetical protein ACOCXG_03165 [Nanoarchaeota archaeon]